MQNNIDVYGNQNLAGILKTLANSLKEVPNLFVDDVANTSLRSTLFTRMLNKVIRASFRGIATRKQQYALAFQLVLFMLVPPI